MFSDPGVLARSSQQALAHIDVVKRYATSALSDQLQYNADECLMTEIDCSECTAGSHIVSFLLFIGQSMYMTFVRMVLYLHYTSSPHIKFDGRSYRIGFTDNIQRNSPHKQQYLTQLTSQITTFNHKHPNATLSHT
jgi:hypothetical protein